MKTYIKLGVIFLSISQVLCACKADDLRSDLEEDRKIEVSQQHNLIKTPYKGYFQKEVKLSMYEPAYGAYLGAYVLANPEIEFDIRRFEQAVDKRVAVALRHYQIGDPFPDQWLLECLAQKKAPHIVITPSDMEAPYDEEALEETAEKFKKTYGIPVFIEFYPGPKDFGDPGKYIAYFQLAQEIFIHHAPNLAFVWSMDMEDVYDSMIYYPGDDYVDWIGMSMYFPIYKNQEKHKVDIEKTLNYFYNMYQGKKPMMISKLAISHYSNKDHTFYIDQATEMIDQIYTSLPSNYPRIKGIHYIDIDNIKVAPESMGKDNFRVSTEPKITRVYKDVIKNPYYLDKLEEERPERGYQWIQMRTPIYQWHEKLYILAEAVEYDWGIKRNDEIKDCKLIIGGEAYYNLDQVVEALDYKYSLSNNKIRIYPKS